MSYFNSERIRYFSTLAVFQHVSGIPVNSQEEAAICTCYSQYFDAWCFVCSSLSSFREEASYDQNFFRSYDFTIIGFKAA